MATLRAPNHPSILTGLFEPTAEVSPLVLSLMSSRSRPFQSVPESQRGNQYGVLTTPSFFQCAGYANQELTDFEVNLTTNTALTNVLEVGALYLISGRLIALNDGSTPTVTYNHDTIVRIPRVGTVGPDASNKTSSVGLGHVVERSEVASEENDSGPRLEVIVAHNDWDAIARTHRRFLVKYIIPGSKNFIKTHTLYQVGRELQLLGHLVDFELDRHMAVFAVHSVSLTSGHQLGRQAAGPSPSGSGSPRNGRKFVKFGSRPNTIPGETASPGLHEPDPSADSMSANAKGKQKATAGSDTNGSDTDEDTNSNAGSPTPKQVDNTNKRGRPRKNILQEAAKRMKRA
ncbi:hypothetical protein PGTUg99_029060 [Puccinia graminis f. sp. tritici]|uniref:Uncharacterized protein n=1 Tax=Puccinia graminis f. sp. tritici TaxID=56615 RepID=A0A5B0PN93_PUCGR|nr:hypothetical protein PGTUg99_029060 [Puccinia graminis f. sp. tritici]